MKKKENIVKKYKILFKFQDALKKIEIDAVGLHNLNDNLNECSACKRKRDIATKVLKEVLVDEIP